MFKVRSRCGSPVYFPQADLSTSREDGVILSDGPNGLCVDISYNHTDSKVVTREIVKMTFNGVLFYMSGAYPGFGILDFDFLEDWDFHSGVLYEAVESDLAQHWISYLESEDLLLGREPRHYFITFAAENLTIDIVADGFKVDRVLLN